MKLTKLIVMVFLCSPVAVIYADETQPAQIESMSYIDASVGLTEADYGSDFDDEGSVSIIGGYMLTKNRKKLSTSI